MQCGDGLLYQVKETKSYTCEDEEVDVGLEEHRLNVVEVALVGHAHRLLHLQHVTHLLDHLALKQTEGLEGQVQGEVGEGLVDRHQVLVHQHELVHLDVLCEGQRFIVQVVYVSRRRRTYSLSSGEECCRQGEASRRGEQTSGA